MPGRRARAGPARGPPAAAQVRLQDPGVAVPLPLWPCPPPSIPPNALLLPAECAGGLVAFTCGKPCPHSCEDLREDTACMATPRCLPACACPHGQLLQDGDCVPPELCRCAWGACWGHMGTCRVVVWVCWVQWGGEDGVQGADLGYRMKWECRDGVMSAMRWWSCNVGCNGVEEMGYGMQGWGVWCHGIARMGHGVMGWQ